MTNISELRLNTNCVIVKMKGRYAIFVLENKENGWQANGERSIRGGERHIRHRSPLWAVYMARIATGLPMMMHVSYILERKERHLKSEIKEQASERNNVSHFGKWAISSIKIHRVFQFTDSQFKADSLYERREKRAKKQSRIMKTTEANRWWLLWNAERHRCLIIYSPVSWASLCNTWWYNGLNCLMANMVCFFKRNTFPSSYVCYMHRTHMLAWFQPYILTDGGRKSTAEKLAALCQS